MNITINSHRALHAKGLVVALRVAAVLGLSASGLALTGVIGGRNADTTHALPSAATERTVPDLQFVYYIVDSQQAATDAVMAERITAQERFIAGIVAPKRVVRFIDNSDAGRITAAEAMLVAQ